MDFAALLAALNQASGFRLYRLRVAIDRVLADPKWISPSNLTAHRATHPRYFGAGPTDGVQGRFWEFRKKES